MISIARALAIFGIALGWVVGLSACTGSAQPDTPERPVTQTYNDGTVVRWDQNSRPKLTPASKPLVGGDQTTASRVAVTSSARTAIPATPTGEAPDVTTREVLGVGLLVGAIACAIAVGVWLGRLRA